MFSTSMLSTTSVDIKKSYFSKSLSLSRMLIREVIHGTLKILH